MLCIFTKNTTETEAEGYADYELALICAQVIFSCC